MNLSGMHAVCLHIRLLHDLCVEDTVNELNLYKLYQINAKLQAESDIKLILIKEKHSQKMQTQWNALITFIFYHLFYLFLLF